MKNVFRYKQLFIIFLTLSINSTKLISQDLGWTHFRGSNLDGISNNEEIPTVWNDSTNITWKTEIHDEGWSSPVILNDQIWITTAKKDGKEMFAVCVDFNSGKIIHDIKLFEPDTVYRKHGVNTYATPTPCVEDGFVYVHFGRYGTACINAQTGSLVWKRTDLQCEHVQGPGSSPILYKNLLILHYEGTDVRFIIALDKQTGKTVWKTDRPEKVYEPLPTIGKKAYITPIIINVDGQDLMISNGSAVIIAYDPNTGKEVWRVIKGAESTVSMPSYENGVIYYYTGFFTNEEEKQISLLMAVDAKGKGNITETNVIWEKESPTLQLSTQLVKDGLLCTIDSKSVFWCLDAKTGEEIWSKKLRGKYNSSPIYCDGKIYFSSTTGTTYVIKHGKNEDFISENKLKGQIWATPAVYKNAILLRTSDYLYKIE